MRMTLRLLATATARIVSVADTTKRSTKRSSKPAKGLLPVHGYLASVSVPAQQSSSHSLRRSITRISSPLAASMPTAAMEAGEWPKAGLAGFELEGKRPGRIGLVGSHLGAAGINIVDFSPGSRCDSGTVAAITVAAITVAAITVDRELPQPQLASLRGIPGTVSMERA